jgi:tripartite-type tricarboxylate transporter receptor subunit TctC
MKKLLLSIILSFTSLAYAGETITIHFSASASQPNAAPYLKMLEVANRLQNKYDFVLEFKPGANGVLAIKAMDTSPTNRLATIAPAFVENSKQGLINENDYVPVATQGDACWAVITNVGDTKQGLASLRGQKEITVGGTGFGNAAHITALMIGEQYGFKVRYIVYKANYDALVNMASGEPINFVLERVANYNTFKTKNPKLQVLAMNCASRNQLIPNVKTTREQGFNTPTVFFATVANKRMPEEKRREISAILDRAQAELGNAYLFEAADMNPPKVSTEEFFYSRVLQMKALTHRYETQINQAR